MEINKDKDEMDFQKFKSGAAQTYKDLFPSYNKDLFPPEPEQREVLFANISKMLMPLVSPYDLSETQRRNQLHNNPIFRATVENVFHLIVDNPLTLDKVLNDMRIHMALKINL